MKFATIKDVAREARVSISTVSRVLNERPDVDPATKAEVLKVIKRLGYERNANASNLKHRHSSFCAVVLRGRRNLFLVDMAERILDCGRKKGLRFLIEIIDEKADEFEAVRGLYRERKLAGAVFLGSNLEGREAEIESLDFPCVFTTVEASTLKGAHVSSVSVDNYASGRLVGEKLISLKHRKIAMLGYFALGSDSTGQRLNGLRDCLIEHGIPFDKELFEESGFSLKSGYEACRRLLSRRQDFTALFAISDLIALGARKALFDRGLRVPEEVSLIGFDGIEQALYSIPPLSTFSQPSDSMAESTVELLLAGISGKPGQHILLPSTFEEGASIRAL